MRNAPSSSSSSGQSKRAAIGSSAIGTVSSAWVRFTLATTASTASRLRGIGSRWPASTPPARTNAMCSLTSGAPSRSATAARCLTRAGSTGFGAAQRQLHPVRVRRPRRGRAGLARPDGRSPCACTDSATTSANRRPGSCGDEAGDLRAASRCPRRTRSSAAPAATAAAAAAAATSCCRCCTRRTSRCCVAGCRRRSEPPPRMPLDLRLGGERRVHRVERRPAVEGHAHRRAGRAVRRVGRGLLRRQVVVRRRSAAVPFAAARVGAGALRASRTSGDQRRRSATTTRKPTGLSLWMPSISRAMPSSSSASRDQAQQPRGRRVCPTLTARPRALQAVAELVERRRPPTGRRARSRAGTGGRPRCRRPCRAGWRRPASGRSGRRVLPGPVPIAPAARRPPSAA